MTIGDKDIVESIELTSSGVAVTGPCNLANMLVGTDGVNNPTITLHDSLDNTGAEKVPTATYKASDLGLKGYMSAKLKRCDTGIFADIACDGDVEVVIDFNHYKVTV